MKKVIVKGFLFSNTAGRDPIVQHYPSTKYESMFLKLIGPCDFEVEIHEVDDLTPITVLSEETV